MKWIGRESLPHQLIALEHLSKNEKAALFMSPGTGKTHTTMKDCFINHYDKDILVISKGGVLPEWEIALKKENLEYYYEVVWLNKGTTKNIKLFTKPKKEKPRLFLISFASSWRMGQGSLMKVKKDSMVLVFDESHYIKESTTKVGKFARTILSDRFKITRLLTGTPISQANNMDLWNQLRVLKIDTPSVKKITDFRNNFTEVENVYRGSYKYINIIGNKNEEILKDIMKEKCLFMSREETGIDFNKSIEVYINVVFDEEQKKALKNKVYKSWMQKNASTLMTYRSVASGFVYGEDKFGKRIVETFKNTSKRDKFEELVISHQKEKIVVYYSFKEELKQIQKVAKELKRKVTEVTSDFRDFSGEIIAINYMSASEGLNLHEYGISTLIFYSPTIVGSQYIQSKMRIDRLGQTKTPIIYKLRSIGSIEEKIWERLEKSQDFTQELFEKEVENE